MVPISSAVDRLVAWQLAELQRLHPFHILMDDQGRGVSAGRALLRLVPPERVLGALVLDELEVVKPRRADPALVMQDVFGQRLTLGLGSLGDAPDMRLFGVALPVNHCGSPHVFLTMTPGVNARAFIERCGLKLADFGPADGSADLMPLLAMQADMLEDSKRKSMSLAAARDAAERMAHFDALTELPNRRALMQGLSKALRRGPVAALHMDLDKFKEINDTYGHAAGDAALRHAAQALRHSLGANALCARLGGDEFVGVLEGETPIAELLPMAGRLIERVSRPFFHEGKELSVGASVGVAMAEPGDALTADDLLHHADLALYESKRKGRGRAILSSPELLRAQSEFQTLCNEIRAGLETRSFVAHLQPQISLPGGHVVGFEALVRWHHPHRGLLRPAAFLAVADRAGLIQDIDAEVRRSALDTLSHADRVGTAIPKVSLNVTMRDLIDPHFREVLLWELEARNLSPARITLEMVESVLYEDKNESIRDACHALVQEGFDLALDDFGTGHASVLSLIDLPVSMVKIDRAFTAGVAEDGRKHVIASSLIGMATTLGLEVMAEGVDSEADVSVLREMGCSQFQSFHFGLPMEAQDTFEWLRRVYAPPKPGQKPMHFTRRSA